MSFCNKCGKWAGAFAAPAGANTDHLCKCLTPAQQSILDALSYEQHQRERIEAAKRYDTEQNKPSLTSGVPVVVAANPALDQGPCTVCGKPWREHGTYPVYESHNYTPARGVPEVPHG